MYQGLGVFNFVRNFSVRFSMRELGRETENYSWQSFTTFISVVRKSFIKNLLMTKSKDRVSDLVNGHAMTIKRLHACLAGFICPCNFCICLLCDLQLYSWSFSPSTSLDFVHSRTN